MKKRLTLSFLIGIIEIFMLASPARAAMILPVGESGSIVFQGYMENFSALRLGQEGKGKCAAFRNTFLPEFLFTFGQRTKLFASARFVREMGYELEDNVRADMGLDPLPDDYYNETDFEAWELFLDVRLQDDLRVRAGKQFIIWGETDVFRLLDIINPQDGSWISPGVMALEETRIPIYAARIVWEKSPFTNLEFIFVPMIDDEENRVDKSAPTGGRWKVTPEGRLGGMDSPVYKAKVYPQMMKDIKALFGTYGPGIIEADVQTKFPESDLDQSRVGVRFTTQIGRWDISLMDYYGHNMSPTIHYDGTDREVRHKLVEDPNTGNAQYEDVNYYIPKISLRYKRQNILGLSFNYFESALTKGIIKGEFAYYHNKPYNIFADDIVTEKDTLSYSLAWEKDCFMPWIHPDDPDVTVFVSLQMFQDVILGSDKDLHVGPYLTPIDKCTTRFTLKTFTSYVHAIYKPEIIAAYDPEGNGLVRGKIVFSPPWSSKYFVELGYVNYWGHKYEWLGLFKEKDSAFLRVRYMW